MPKLVVRMFGGFDALYSGRALSDLPNRSTKMWTALKYLIAHHKRSVSTEELIEVLWPEEDSSDPLSLLKSVIYRLRKMLTDALGDIKFISFSQGSYQWNPDVVCDIDAAKFEALILKASDSAVDMDERIEHYSSAIRLYSGGFLQGENSDLWLMNFRNYYRRLYLGAIGELTALYEQAAAFEEAASVYNEAIKIEPYEESLYEQSIRALIQTGEYASARQQYQSIEKLLLKEFGTEPSEELRSLRLEINNNIGNPGFALDLTELKMRLDKDAAPQSAILCGIETFRRIYSYDKYLDERMKFPVFLASVSVQVINASDDADDRLQSAMTALRRIMLRTLRQCDIVCRNSASSFILMLTVPDAEHKMAPLNRIRRLFENEPDARGITLDVQAIPIGESVLN